MYLPLLHKDFPRIAVAILTVIKIERKILQKFAYYNNSISTCFSRRAYPSEAEMKFNKNQYLVASLRNICKYLNTTTTDLVFNIAQSAFNVQWAHGHVDGCVGLRLYVPLQFHYYFRLSFPWILALFHYYNCLGRTKFGLAQYSVSTSFLAVCMWLWQPYLGMDMDGYRHYYVHFFFGHHVPL